MELDLTEYVPLYRAERGVPVPYDGRAKGRKNGEDNKSEGDGKVRNVEDETGRVQTAGKVGTERVRLHRGAQRVRVPSGGGLSSKQRRVTHGTGPDRVCGKERRRNRHRHNVDGDGDRKEE